MGARNLAARGDLSSEELRQRRDLYAIAIGLLLFNLAGGTVGEAMAFGSVLPVKLKHPSLLLWAAWLSMLYFWLRFWMVTEGQPIAAFLEDARWQAGRTRWMRRIAARRLTKASFQNPTVEELKALIQRPDGHVPLPYVLKGQAHLDLSHLRPRRGASVIQEFGRRRVEITGNDIPT